MIKVNWKILPEYFAVAVSGGVDSIAAAHLLHKMGYEFRIYHYNHQVQKINDEMSDKVNKFARDHDIECYSGKRNEEYQPLPEKGSIEEYLRGLRLELFKTFPYDVVCCHHLDDAVEQYTMNFLRGCPEYIPIRWETPLEGTNHKILHPFLNTTKEDLIKYAENNDLMKYVVVDPSNSDNKYRRNWVRNEVLPQFQEFGLQKIVRKKYYM